MGVIGSVAGWLGQKGRQVADAVSSGSGDRQPWPPKEHGDRLRRYADGEKLYLANDVAKLFEERGFRYNTLHEDDWPYIPMNFLAAATDLVTGRAAGESVQVRGPGDMPVTQAFLDGLFEENSFSRVLIEAMAEASYAGDACLKVRYDASEERVVIEPFSPAIYYPETHPMDVRSVVAANVCMVMRTEKQAYLLVERHELRGEGDGRRAWIVNRLFRLEGEANGQKFSWDPARDEVDLAAHPYTEGLPEEQDTGIDMLPVVHIPNKTTRGSRPWGISDYAGLINIQGQINATMTQRARIIRMHAEPSMYGPSSSLDENGQLRSSKSKFWGLPDAWTGPPPIGYVTWLQDLTASENLARELREAFCAGFGIDMSALVPADGGGPQSGTALRLSQMRTQTKAMEKQAAFDPAIRRVFSIATRMAAALGLTADGARVEALDPRQITVVWSDGLPRDEREEVEIQAARLEQGTQSRVAAISALDGMTAEDAEAKLVQIQQEAGTGAPTPGVGAPLTFGGLAGLQE